MSRAQYAQVSNDLDRMAQMSCALEAYGEILSSQRVDLQGPVGQALQLGLEAIDPNIDIKEGSVVTLRAIKEGVIQLAKMTRNAIRIIFELIGSFYVKFTGSLGAVRTRQKKVGKRLGKLGGKVAYTKMEVSGITRLCVNGRFVGDAIQSLNDIKQVTDFILNTYPKGVANVARDASRQFMNLVEEAVNTPEGQKAPSNADVAKRAVAAFSASLSARLPIPPTFESASHKELPAAFKDGGAYHRSAVLAGNYALVLSHPGDVSARGEKTATSNYAALIGSAFTCRFLELPLNTADRAVREVEVPSVQTLNQLLTAVSDILTLAERGESGRKDFETVKHIVDDTIRQVAERSTDVSNANNVVIHMLGAMSKKLGEPMGSFTHWLAVTLNIYLAFIDHCINHFREEGV